MSDEKEVVKKGKKEKKKGGIPVLSSIRAWTKKHKKLTVFLIIIAILFWLISRAVSCVQKSQALIASMMNASLTAEVSEEELINSLSATGTITSVESKVMTSSVTGVNIELINVSLGEQVEPGDILCVLDSDNLEANLADAKKSREAARGRSGIEVTSANRGYNEAVTSQSIDIDRAEKDVKDAYNDVNRMANDCQEALDKYNAAENALNDAEKVKAQAETMLYSAQGAADDMAQAQRKFEATKQEFINYISTRDDAEKGYFNINMIQLGNIDAMGDELVTLTYYGKDEAIENEVKTTIKKLKECEVDYFTFKKKNDESAQAQANYSAACSQVEAAKAQRDVAKSQYDALAKSVENGWDLYNQKVRVKEDVIRNDASAVAARGDSVKSANINASVATMSEDSTIKKVEEQIDNCVIKSSISGIVTSISVNEGDMYAGGAIVTIEDTSSYEVTSFIGEYDIAKVKVGQKVTIKTNGTGDAELEGVVREVSPRASSNTANGVTYPVKISILTKNDDLRLDMTAKINIVTEEKSGAICVPYEAVQTDEDGNFYVNVLDGDAPLSFADLQDPLKAATMTEDQKAMAKGDKQPDSHKVIVKKGLQNNYFIEVFGVEEELVPGVVVVYPNDTSYTDVMDYIQVYGGY